MKNVASAHIRACRHVKVFVYACGSTNLAWGWNTLWERTWRPRSSLPRTVQRWFHFRLPWDTWWNPWREGSFHQVIGTFWTSHRCRGHQIWSRNKYQVKVTIRLLVVFLYMSWVKRKTYPSLHVYKGVRCNTALNIYCMYCIHLING